MDIENYGEKRRGKPFHHHMLPDDIRMLVVGQSGCGKTNLVINLVMKYIKWSKLYMVTNTPDQKIYDSLRQLPKPESKIMKKNVDFLSPEDLSQEIFDDMPPLTLIVFDDFMLEKDQTFPALVFSQGRHKRVNSIYISQKFTETNLVIRQNANSLVMFNIDSKSREGEHSMYATADMDVSDFNKIILVGRVFSYCTHELQKQKIHQKLC